MFFTQKDSKDVVIEQDDYPEGFYKAPFCSYEGHGSDVLDLSWSKVYISVKNLVKSFCFKQ